MKIALCATALLFAACATPVRITERAANGPTHLPVGATLILELPQNPGTGCRWEQNALPADGVLSQTGEPTFTPGAAPAGMVGVPGTLGTTYLAKKAGSQILVWKNLPPGQGRPPAATLSFPIVVR